LILVATTPGQLGDGEVPPADEVPQPPEEMLALMGSPLADDAEMEQMLWKLLPYYFHRPDMAVLAPLFEGTTYRLAAMIRGFEVLAGWSSVDRLATVTVPTLVVAGRHDLFTSWPQSFRIANRLPDADVVVLEESGHFPWIEQPDEFFQAVR
jgi:proline iminopeptidase